MGSFVVLLAGISLCSAGVVPAGPRNRTEDIGPDGRYAWVPDGEDGMTLVDLHAPVSEEELREAERQGQNNRYYLFTRRNPRDSQTLIHNNIASVRNSHYNGRLPLMVLVHGYNMNRKSDMNRDISNAYLNGEDANVIVVCWRAAATGLYSTSVNAVPSIGQFLGNFLIWLFNTSGGNWNNLHLVGFSLGAHVVGNAGRTIGRRAGRITGLDPAGPLWGGNSNALNRNDGLYVESIHSNGGWYGIFDPISDVDFYPNGGRSQPGCSSNVCDHNRAPELFVSSVRTNHFVGRQCGNIQQVLMNLCTGSSFNMGNAILSKRGRGLYRVNTQSRFPF